MSARLTLFGADVAIADPRAKSGFTWRDWAPSDEAAQDEASAAMRRAWGYACAEIGRPDEPMPDAIAPTRPTGAAGTGAVAAIWIIRWPFRNAFADAFGPKDADMDRVAAIAAASQACIEALAALSFPRGPDAAPATTSIKVGSGVNVMTFRDCDALHLGVTTQCGPTRTIGAAPGTAPLREALMALNAMAWAHVPTEEKHSLGNAATGPFASATLHAAASARALSQGPELAARAAAALRQIGLDTLAREAENPIRPEEAP